LQIHLDTVRLARNASILACNAMEVNAKEQEHRHDPIQSHRGIMKKTIMLIHGAWVTPDSWENFRNYFEGKGHTCMVPAWPYMHRSVCDLRESPDPQLKHITIKLLVDHFERQIKILPEPPILIGHSFGGLIVQMLLDRGLGASGVAIDAGPSRGVIPSLTAIRSAASVLFAWMGRGGGEISRMGHKVFKSLIGTWQGRLSFNLRQHQSTKFAEILRRAREGSRRCTLAG
jgi:pimeloyl-ACP methyl ester carboxylesterase